MIVDPMPHLRYLALLLLPLPALADFPALMALEAGGARVSAAVYDLDRETAVATLHPRDRLSPASVSKLVTAAAALEVWPADKTFATRLSAARPPVNGVLAGELTLSSEGDAMLDHQALFALAAQLRGLGVHTVNGGITVSTAPFGPLGCETKDRCESLEKSATAYNAPLAAIGVDYGSWCIEVKPLRIGAPAVIRSCGGVTLPMPVEGVVTVVGPGQRQTFFADRFTGTAGDVLRVGGNLPIGGGQTLYRAMSDPSLGAGQLLRETLRALGIRVTGSVGVSSDKPAIGIELASHDSVALKEQLGRMLRHSNNFVADQLTLNIAVASGRKPGPLAEAGEALADYVAKVQALDTDEKPALFSGSGLTPESRISAQELLAVLAWQYRDSRRFPAFYGGLVVPREGPYAFLRRGGNKDWLDRVALKTGTMSEPISVNSMAGYLRKKNGGWMAFAIIVNGSPRQHVVPFWKAIDAIRNDIEAILARY